MATIPNASNLGQFGSVLMLIWERGDCRNMQVETATYDPFFPDGNSAKATREAKRICARCPVRERCLQYALDTDQPEGVWGGYTAAERRRMDLEEAV